MDTTDIGVWTTGFFGSGKSHLLKMISYILSNQDIEGRRAIDYFEEKIKNRNLIESMKRCASIKTEAIIFNIDAESPSIKDATAILKVFAKVFYNHIGFYGNDLRIAAFEERLKEAGVLDAFRRNFHELSGKTWLESRNLLFVKRKSVIEVLQKTFGVTTDEATKLLNDNAVENFSIRSLSESIKSYINTIGSDARLLFFVDEVGQYIGSDTNLMLNLQSMVEELGRLCSGRVWVLVTSQESIDSSFTVKGNDFSKIQARFNTRISLTSSSVDEVIKKRILQKDEEYIETLANIYKLNQTNLKNLFTFEGAKADLKGYENETDFIDCYPFVGYQFKLLQNTLMQIRKHGSTGRHLSSGERSMLSAFQEALQRIQNKDINSLVPFSYFFNTINSFLEHPIAQVFVRCEKAAKNRDGLELEDVEVLKVLFLIRYVDDVQSTLENVCVLLIDNVNFDKLAAKASVKQSLDRLLTQNYISRQGETYSFLTDDEQDITREIRSMTVDQGKLVSVVGQYVFGDIYSTSKIRYKNRYDFPYKKWVDNMEYAPTNAPINLRILMDGSNESQTIQESLFDTSGGKVASVLLSDEESFIEDLIQVEQTLAFVKQKPLTSLTPIQQNIVQQRQQEAKNLQTTIKDRIGKAIVKGSCFVGRTKVEIAGASPKDKIDNLMAQLIRETFPKIELIDTFYEKDSDIRQILNRSFMQTADGDLDQTDNVEAQKEVLGYLELTERTYSTVSMTDIQKRYQAPPYGFREIEIAGVVASLVQGQKISIQRSGAIVQLSDGRFVDYLRKHTETDNIVLKRRTSHNETSLKQLVDFTKKFFNVYSIPMAENEIHIILKDNFRKLLEELTNAKNEYNYMSYPDKDIIDDGLRILNSLKSYEGDAYVYLTEVKKSINDLLAWYEDYSDVKSFFKDQKEVFKSAFLLIKDEQRDWMGINLGSEGQEAFKAIKFILEMPKPYGRINELPTLMATVTKAYSQVLEDRKCKKIEELENSKQQLLQEIQKQFDNKMFLSVQEEKFSKLINECRECKSISKLSGFSDKASELTDRAFRELHDLHEVKHDEPVRIASYMRNELLPIRIISKEEEIDQLVEALREKLKRALAENDRINIK